RSTPILPVNQMSLIHSAVTIVALCGIASTAGAQMALAVSVDSTSDSTASGSTAPAVDAKRGKPGLDFSGWVFGDFQLTTDEASKAANGGKAPNRFDIGRAYLN